MIQFERSFIYPLRTSFFGIIFPFRVKYYFESYSASKSGCCHHFTWQSLISSDMGCLLLHSPALLILPIIAGEQIINLTIPSLRGMSTSSGLPYPVLLFSGSGFQTFILSHLHGSLTFRFPCADLRLPDYPKASRPLQTVTHGRDSPRNVPRDSISGHSPYADSGAP